MAIYCWRKQCLITEKHMCNSQLFSKNFVFNLFTGTFYFFILSCNGPKQPPDLLQNMVISQILIYGQEFGQTQRKKQRWCQSPQLEPQIRQMKFSLYVQSFPIFFSNSCRNFCNLPFISFILRLFYAVQVTTNVVLFV